MINNKEFGQKLKELRGNMSQEEFAYKIGVDRSVYAKFEAGLRVSTVKFILMVCEATNVSADYLFGTNINANVDFTYIKDLIADINTTEIASHLNNMDEWTAKWRAEAEKALYKISEDCLK